MEVLAFFPSFVLVVFNADLQVFFVLIIDLIMEMVLSSDSSSSWTHFLLGNARSRGDFSAAR